MKLLFIYNANSGSLNAMMDSAHKFLSPSTYECDLCSLTFGMFKEKKVWSRFRESVHTPMQFLHKDEFLKAYRSKWLPKYEFPIVLAETDKGMEVVVSKNRFESIDTPEDLIQEIKNILEL